MSTGLASSVEEVSVADEVCSWALCSVTSERRVAVTAAESDQPLSLLLAAVPCS